MLTLTSFKNSYIITARGSPSSTYYANIAPLPDNELWFYTAPGQITSLGDTFIPSDFQRQNVSNNIVPASRDTPPNRAIDRLIANGILEQREVAGIAMLRFSLDPAAEYLAAIGEIRRLRSDRGEWESFLQKIQSAGSYPNECSGFLLALSICYKTYLTALKLPALNFPWEPETISDTTLVTGQSRP